jgi:hypothetical protein
MKKNELFSHYSLTECSEQESVLKKLDELMDNGKIEFYYEIMNERFKLIDLELSDSEISELLNLFYDKDVVPDMDYEEPDDYNDHMGYYEDYE